MLHVANEISALKKRRAQFKYEKTILFYVNMRTQELGLITDNNIVTVTAHDRLKLLNH